MMPRTSTAVSPTFSVPPGAINGSASRAISMKE